MSLLFFRSRTNPPRDSRQLGRNAVVVSKTDRDELGEKGRPELGSSIAVILKGSFAAAVLQMSWISVLFG